MHSEFLFDGDKWKSKALLDYCAFKELDQFIRNPVAISAHLESSEVSYFSDFSTEEGMTEEGMTEDPSQDSNPFQGFNGGLLESKAADLQGILSRFASHTIVSFCTTYEVTSRHFLQTYFSRYPLAMIDYVGPERAKGYVALKEIVKFESRRELIQKLAESSAAIVSKGKYGDVFRRITKIAGGSASKDLEKSLNAIQNERNKIVHEKNHVPANLEAIDEFHALIDKVIEELCSLAIGKGLPGRYTCIRGH